MMSSDDVRQAKRESRIRLAMMVSRYGTRPLGIRCTYCGADVNHWCSTNGGARSQNLHILRYTGFADIEREKRRRARRLEIIKTGIRSGGNAR